MGAAKRQMPSSIRSLTTFSMTPTPWRKGLCRQHQICFTWWMRKESEFFETHTMDDTSGSMIATAVPVTLGVVLFFVQWQHLHQLIHPDRTLPAIATEMRIHFHPLYDTIRSCLPKECAPSTAGNGKTNNAIWKFFLCCHYVVKSDFKNLWCFQKFGSGSILSLSNE